MFATSTVGPRKFEGGWRCALWLSAVGAVCCSALAGAQVLTIDTSGRPTTAVQSASVDRRFAQVQPTHVQLPQEELTTRGRQALIRALAMEQGFAMRPFPGGHKGLTLEANGKLDPAGEAYVDMVTDNGVSAKPGDRVVITDIKIERSRITLDFNGGPDLKHRFLRHIYLGDEIYDYPIIQDDGSMPTGARISLVFHDHVPNVTGDQVEGLLAPLISFKVKTPIQAFTDTLPPMLKDAILNHQVLVGMDTDMVLYAKGHPDRRIREMDGQMPIEEWIYGKPPQTVEFVRINGNRVIRVEIAVVGKQPVVYSRDVVEGMMRTDGTPVVPTETAQDHTIQLGDVHRDPNTQAPAPPPTLAAPGETMPGEKGKDSRVDVMKPVQFPKQTPDDAPVAHKPGTQTSAPAPAGNGSVPLPASSSSTGTAPTQPPAAPPAQAPASPPAQQFAATMAQLD